MILCSQCGAGIEPQQNFCLNCGQPVRRTDRPPVPAAESAPASTQNSAIAPQDQSPVVPSKSPNRLAIVLIVAGLLATAAVSVVVTVALVQRKGDEVLRKDDNVATNTGRLSPAPGPTAVRITATASSTRASIGGGPYMASNVLDGSVATAWVEGVGGPGIGEWIQLDFNREVALSRAHITPGYFKSERLWAHNNRLAAATFQFSDGTVLSVSFADRMESQSVELGGKKSRWVRLTIDRIYGGARDSDDTPISEISLDLTP